MNFRKPNVTRLGLSFTLNIILGLGALLLLAVSVAKDASLKEKVSELDVATTKIKAMSNTIGELTTAQPPIQLASMPSDDELSALKSKLEAFAKQAQSCALLKQKLRIKE